MGKAFAQSRSLKDLRGVALAGLALLFIIGWLLFGTTGLFAWGDYSRALSARQVELAELKATEASLRNRERLLDPRHVDPDLSEELVRLNLNLLHPDDIVVPLR